MKADTDDEDLGDLEYGAEGDGWVAGYCWLCLPLGTGHGSECMHDDDRK